jgi:hypothetical protein
MQWFCNLHNWYITHPPLRRIFCLSGCKGQCRKSTSSSVEYDSCHWCGFAHSTHSFIQSNTFRGQLYSLELASKYRCSLWSRLLHCQSLRYWPQYNHYTVCSIHFTPILGPSWRELFGVCEVSRQRWPSKREPLHPSAIENRFFGTKPFIIGECNWVDEYYLVRSVNLEFVWHFVLYHDEVQPWLKSIFLPLSFER